MKAGGPKPFPNPITSNRPHPIQCLGQLRPIRFGQLSINESLTNQKPITKIGRSRLPPSPKSIPKKSHLIIQCPHPCMPFPCLDGTRSHNPKSYSHIDIKKQNHGNFTEDINERNTKIEAKRIESGSGKEFPVPNTKWMQNRSSFEAAILPKGQRIAKKWDLTCRNRPTWSCWRKSWLQRKQRERRGRADLRKDLNSGKMGKNAGYIRREGERESSTFRISCFASYLVVRGIIEVAFMTRITDLPWWIYVGPTWMEVASRGIGLDKISDWSQYSCVLDIWIVRF